MKIFDIAKRVWNSEAMDTFADITMGTLECLGEIICDTFSQGSTSNKMNLDYHKDSDRTDVEKETFEYWARLDSDAQEYYYNNNEYLKVYGDSYYYKDSYQMAKSVAEIARKENRAFTDIGNRY